jgi:hypothetical protein
MVNWKRFWHRWGVALSLREPPTLPSFAWSYFDHLAAVYLTLNATDDRVNAVITKAKEQADDLTWGDIFLLENIVFSLQPADVVQRNAWIIRERFREIACPTVYNKYVASNFPTETDTPEKLSLLRADLTRVLDVLHWYYSLIPDRERLRKSLTASCLRWTLFYTVVLIAVLVSCVFWKQPHPTVALAACVVYWGIIGGFVSSQRRMQSIPSDGDPLISVIGLDSASYYLWLSPLLGAIFAVILTWMFLGGLLSGALFPSFTFPEGGKNLGLVDFILKGQLATTADYGKLFVWAFLAGFAERLVPDNLDRLASKLETHDQSAAHPPATVSGATVPQGNHPAAEAQEPRPPIETKTIQDVLHAGVVQPEEEDRK